MKFAALLIFLLPGTLPAATPVCNFADSDSDGDGWGWENEQTCQAIASASADVPGCDYSAADLHGGWGWNTSTASSCPPLDSQNTLANNTASIEHPSNGCDYSVADLHGGWGWNATTASSCPPLTGEKTVSAGADTDTGCDYSAASQHGGWGWNAATATTCPPLDDQTIDVTADTDNSCDYSAASQHGGWGWNAATATTCPPLDDQTIDVTADPDNSCDYSVASQHGGWGWNAATATTCPPLDDQTIDVTADTDNSCDYSAASQHGGWGWNAATATTCPPLDDQTIDVTADTDNSCDYSAASQHGGWGWNATTNTSCAPITESTVSADSVAARSDTASSDTASSDTESSATESAVTESINNKEVATPESAPEPEPSPEPEPTPTTEPDPEPVVESVPPAAVSQDNILIALHFDIAPDLDDLHAMAAGCNITRRFKRNPAVVIGTYGLANVGDNLAFAYLTETNTRGQGRNDGRTRQQRANEVAALAYTTYLDTGNGWTNAVNTQAAKWWAVLSTGGSIRVADGGPMDFTADVLVRLKNVHAATAAQLKRIHVVQHSAGFNLWQTRSSNMQLIQQLAEYKPIPNGNVTGNGTAGLKPASTGGTTTGSFANWARNENECSAAWIAALNSFTGRIDFSDTVEYLSIIGSETQSITDVNSFADFF